MGLLLRNGRVVDPSQGLDESLDVLIEDGKIARLERRLTAQGVASIDLRGKVLAPGFIDMHAHLREPGEEWKETVASGTAAAAAGGFCSVACMPNTNPVNDERAVTEFILGQARKSGRVRVYPIAAVSKGLSGEELAEMGDLVDGGAIAVSDDGKPVASGRLLRLALEYARIFGIPVIDHCEDPDLSDGGVVNEGYISTLLGLKGWNRTAEDTIVARDIAMAAETAGRIHIAHVSTEGSLELIRRARAGGVRVSCEVTPHHLTLTEEACLTYDTTTKMNPPLRTGADREALLEGLKDGTVDVIATDHAPHHSDEKNVEFSRAPFGVIGLETAVSLALDRLVRPGMISIGRMVELMSVNPARILGVPGGTLKPGAPADITVLDLEREFSVEPARFHSLSRNTPFGGWSLRGGPVATIVAGEIVHSSLD
ncbi:MAG: dihydroorotase [Acidobacteria bacterium]|nr:MAG: dihydroorotase [Acidobacteriota bacterium]